MGAPGDRLFRAASPTTVCRANLIENEAIVLAALAAGGDGMPRPRSMEKLASAATGPAGAASPRPTSVLTELVDYVGLTADQVRGPRRVVAVAGDCAASLARVDPACASRVARCVGLVVIIVCAARAAFTCSQVRAVRELSVKVAAERREMAHLDKCVATLVANRGESAEGVSVSPDSTH